MSEEPVRRNEGELSGHRVWKNLLNIGIFIAQVLLLVLVGPAAVKFFLPVIVGWVIAQIANPPVRFLEKHLHIVRRHSSFGIIFGTIFLIALLLYNGVLWLWSESGRLIGKLPVYYEALVQGIDRIAENLQGFTSRMPLETRERIGESTEYFTSSLGKLVSGLGGGTVEAAGNAAKNIPSLLISFIFVLLFAYFFIAQRERISRIVRKVFSEEKVEQLVMIWSKVKQAVGGYFRAQFKIMGIVGVILAVGFLFMGIDYGILLAAVIALLDFLPMLGTGTVLLPWALFCALSDALPRAAGLLILYAVTQVTRQLIQPKMVGDSIGVDTLTTLFLLFIGYRLGGLLGMIVAVPVGLILIQFYEAGAFAHIVRNVKELSETIHDWRFRE
ncbi:MAG: sporulation integral membrane protein YtvI [Clostridiales bacterium]|nr:sporulation integral membrane protein YtvI [Clostridiales bacterium]